MPRVPVQDPAELGSRMERKVFRSSDSPNSGRWLCVITTERGEHLRVVRTVTPDQSQVCSG